jgi:RNA polymerase sigma factor for flagellar operon FliA
MLTYADKPDTKNDLLMQNSALVKKIAYQLKAKLPASVELDDLIQVGMMGLFDAVNRYEDNHGAQFVTYASQRIRGAMLDELRSNDWLPRSMRKNMRDVETAIQALEQKFGRSPTEGEIARHLELSIEDYQLMLGDCGGHQLVYYEDFGEDDGGESFLDRYMEGPSQDPIQALLSTDFRDAVIHAIESLPEREKVLMGLYYEQELNLKEIGAIMNVSESRVSQLHSQSIARLRASLKEQAWTGVA